MKEEPELLVAAFVDGETGKGIVWVRHGDKKINLTPEQAILFALAVLKSAEEAETNEILYQHGNMVGGREAARHLIDVIQTQRASRAGLMERITKAD